MYIFDYITSRHPLSFIYCILDAGDACFGIIEEDVSN
mgnify:CR=1 FL=1